MEVGPNGDAGESAEKENGRGIECATVKYQQDGAITAQVHILRYNLVSMHWRSMSFNFYH